MNHHRYSRQGTDPVKLPGGERAGVVVPDAHLVRSSDVGGLDLELVGVARLELVTGGAIVQPDVIGLDRLAALVLAVDDQLDAGVRAGASLVRRVHDALPRHH